ncbi:hypothetical protein [Thiobacillus sedimenti]|uniref:AAA+ ATPase domain-containing protein n=1 Tax=Thiobacillus sedimenti TaxID=3110231 RepID=A0ABZ1CJ18_9PROT|nr:hypothetical protein [Thiobacillus sp. SCUT-2]WRS39247.1 hypothetical protein VA613_14765 [Thiobacillus sp. SCUT-2]
MSMSKTANPWIEPYKLVLSDEEIRRRTEVHGEPVEDLDSDLIEVACNRLNKALKAVFIATAQSRAIIRSELERAIAYGLVAYPNRIATLQRIYSPPEERESEFPVVITGPSGTGKTELEKAIRRLLMGRRHIDLGEAHGPFPQDAYRSLRVKGMQSVLEFMKPLAKPEIALGEAKARVSDMPNECAAWLYRTGTCLLGVDELQFLTQSDNASTHISKVLMACMEIGIPWHYVCNYSLGWRLMKRPHEITQRLQANISILVPDPPASEDWIAILKQYQKIAKAYFEFELTSHALELWNLSAGLKRELVKLLVLAYRLSRHRQVGKVSWKDIQDAYTSASFSKSRKDIELLIRYAAQGGELRDDLRCPFTGGSITQAIEAYENNLRNARNVIVARATLDASLTEGERKAADNIQKKLRDETPPKRAHVVKLPVKPKRTLQSLQSAGRKFKTGDKPPETQDA